MKPPDERLLSFCGYYGFDAVVLSGADKYRIEYAGENFDGAIDTIRLTELGRFGNVFYQLLHASLLARHIGCARIEFFPFQCGPPEGQYQIEDLTFVCAREHQSSRPTLVGHFFNSYGFQSALSGYGRTVLLDTIERFLRPLFAHLPKPATCEDDLIVMNFRGGDVMRGPVIHEWYVQPPAAYYLRAGFYARDVFGHRHVLIVAEDRSNPAIDVTEDVLRKNGFDVSFQSESLEKDLETLSRAVHLVSPYGTLCEAAAMLSNCLVTYFAFRQFESHRHLHPQRPALLLQLLQARGVRPVRILDPMKDYVAPRTWQRSADQIEMMRHFPPERLALHDLSLEPDDTDDCFEKFPLPALMSPAEEAYHLRTLLLAAREQSKIDRAAWSRSPRGLGKLRVALAAKAKMLLPKMGETGER